MNFKDQVKELVDKALSNHPELFLTDLTVGTDNTIRITIDGDKGVCIDDCIELSRAVEGALDRETVDFALEVTSFGATEPFVMERQYTKNAGRTVQITTLDGKTHEGVLKGLQEGKAVLETETREPKPVALRMVYDVAHAVNLPVIGLGGISTPEDAIEFFMAGATAIQVGTANFIDPQASFKIRDGISRWLDQHSCISLRDIIGCCLE